MKKIIIIFIMLFAFTRVRAEEVEIRLEWIPNVYYSYTENGITHWGQFAYLYVDDKIAYCLDISQNINSMVYKETNEIQKNNLVNLAGYFGYGYEENLTLKDYIATQKLIWQYLGTNAQFTTESGGKGSEIDVRNEEIKIINKINNYAVFPSYDSNYKFIIGSNNYLEQTNGIKGNYNIINQTKNKITIDNSSLLFEANEIGMNEFYLETKYEKRYDNVIYEAKDSQKIMVIGNINNVNRFYSYEVIGGSISINVNLNSNGSSYLGNVLENVFEIYNDKGILIGTYSADINGKIFVNNLYLGKYILKHINVSKGYNVDVEEYIVELTKDNLDIKKDINLYSKKINVQINKTYGNNLSGVLAEEGIIYKIYNDNNVLINEICTNQEGNAFIELEYGNYIIKQYNTNKVNIHHEDIIIDKNMFENNQVINIFDEIYEIKLHITLLEKNTNLPVTDTLIEIRDNIFNLNENGEVYVNLTEFGCYTIIVKNNEKYMSINDIEHMINKSNLYLKEGELYSDLVIYLEKNEEIVNDINSLPKDDIIDEEITDKNNDLKEDEQSNNDVVVDSNDNIDKLPFLGINNENFKNNFNNFNFNKFARLYKI